VRFVLPFILQAQKYSELENNVNSMLEEFADLEGASSSIFDDSF
jgi:hypothetical protein